MSGICGILNLDGAPVDRGLLERMSGAMAYRGPDGAGHWVDGPVGLGHRMFRTTPEALRERQPLTDEDGAFCLVLDGRVDNRTELRKALTAKGLQLRDDTDAELVLRAYRCWGAGAPERIIGDFAFAFWDAGQRRLFCARDALGIRPFYYLRDDRRFLFGSDLRAIFADPAVRREPNLGMVGEYLADQVVSAEETLYKQVMRLPAAHTLIVAPGHHEKRRYWDVDPGGAIRYRTDGEYAGHFREVFTEAVRCRMRGVGPVGAELSGGLDSSSVVAVAAGLRGAEGAAAAGFETFSLVFPGMSCDESGYIKAVVGHVGVVNHTVSPLIAGLDFYRDQTRRYLDIPDSPNGVMCEPLWDLAQKRGVRVLLTGQGGDHWFTGSEFRYADHLKGLRLLALLRDLKGDPGTLKHPRRLLSYGILPFLSPDTKRRIKKLLGKKPRWAAWIDERFAREIGLANRVHPRDEGKRIPSFAQAELHQPLRSGWQSLVNDCEDRAAAWHGLEPRHPFFDRRVVEFALAIPEEQRWRGGGIKHIMREAMRGMLPEEVRTRATKAEFSPVTIETLQRFEGEGLMSLRGIGSSLWLKNVEIERIFLRIVEQYRNDKDCYTDIWPLWLSAAIGMWESEVIQEDEGHQGSVYFEQSPKSGAMLKN